jgi:dTDP-4-dehydrorhamnose 3,5-epimerase
MRFAPTEIPGVVVVDLDLHADSRGFFARSWCEQEAAAHGVAFGTVQCNISFNHRRGTLRGMHYQVAPHEEAKIVRCSAGALLDVIVDIRPESPSYRRFVAVELSAENRRAVHIPKGCAHGFLTLADNTEVFYQMSDYYAPEFARGFRWNDPYFNITWPAGIDVISDRDRAYADFEPQVADPTHHV